MRIVIFGLTGDPFTSAHMSIVRQLSERFDKVLVVPTTIRYYKKNTQMFSFNERYEAIKSKVSNISNVDVLDTERNVDEDWRTIDTIWWLQCNCEFPKDAEWYYAMGADSFVQFPTWSQYESILNKVKLVVFGRPGVSKESFPKIEHEFIEMNMDISSTKLRAKIVEFMSRDDFDEMIDDMSFTKGFEEYL